MITQIAARSQQQGWGYSIRRLCRLLGVNRAWYYERQQVAERRVHAEHALRAMVEPIIQAFPRYGYRRVTKALQHTGHQVNHKRVLRLLRQWNLLCRPLRKRHSATTQADPTAAHAANLLRTEQPAISGPNQVWMGDVLEVQTRTERGYIATLIDGYSRRCVGWAVGKDNDTGLTLTALNQALQQRQPAPGLIHHTDRGSNYTSAAYQQRLQAVQARVSHSRPGRPQENGMAESFNKTIRYDHLYLEEYTSLDQVAIGFGEWVHQRYNACRLHSALGYLAPDAFEQQWRTRQRAAGSGLV